METIEIIVWVFPARAGMSRRARPCWLKAMSVPRASGDEPEITPSLGNLAHVFPARAGMSHPTHRVEKVRGSVPRASGDEPGVSFH